MASTYIAHRSPKRMMALIGLLGVLGALMMVLDLSWMVSEGSGGLRAQGRANTLETLIMILPWIGGFALLVALAFLPTVFRKRVEIEISETGISYPPALQDVLPWDRIERVAVRKMSVYRVLAVFIRDAESFPIKGMARKVAQLNKASGDYGDINIEVMRSDGDFDALVAAVEGYVRVQR